MKYEWRCTRCRKLLGIVEDSRLRIRFARGHHYDVGLPAQSVCRGCNAANELTHPGRSRVAHGSLAKQ